VEYANGKWWFVVPGECTATISDGKQTRVVVGALMNPRVLLETEDMEMWASEGPTLIRNARKPVNVAASCNDTDAMEDDALTPSAAHEEQSKTDLASAILPLSQRHMRAGRDSAFLDLLSGEETRHTGDAGDYRLIHDLDRRVAALKAGIEDADARGDEKMAAALNEEKTSLRKYRNWYVNVMTGKLKPFYSKEVDDKVHRCRMWIVRGLQALAAKGLTKSVASLDAAISRGMKFQYDEQPEYKWVVTLPPHGSLPVLDKPRGGKHAGSKVAA